jgi:hypothetical protein
MKEHHMTDTLAADTAAELKIRNLISRIALLADQGNLDEYIDQFTEDAVWDFPNGPRHGRADILAGATERRADKAMCSRRCRYRSSTTMRRRPTLISSSIKTPPRHPRCSTWATITTRSSGRGTCGVWPAATSRWARGRAPTSG